ncbi:MAG: SCO family protein [Planctomycetes bacterium]|nr:SCO family protein [Planctomycetota bacterium]
MPFQGRRTAPSRSSARRRIAGLLLAALALSPTLPAQEYARDTTVGIEPKLGETAPLDLIFNDEQGRPVALRSLVTRPTILCLVYFRCPSICKPLLQEVARTVGEIDLEPGIDYNLITVSFDTEDKPDAALANKELLLASIGKKIPPESWRFLTGEAESIARLTDGVGYRFRLERGFFNHPSEIIFLSPTGKIVRYLPGLKILPSHMRLAILDAAEGRPRSFLQRLESLCYGYDTEAKTYVLKVNRIILGITLFGLGLFLLYLLLSGKRGGKAERPSETSRSGENG